MSPERHTNNPYVGPRPFERNEDDSVRFFGRTQETQEIVSLIFGHPILLVYALSGAGKTSLFNASIATTLEDDGFDVLPITRVQGGVPENISIEEIKNLYIFNAILNMEPEADPQAFVTKTLTDYLEIRPRANDESGEPVPRILIFDQFEELFTVTTQGWLEQREAFFHQITEALTVDPLLRVVLVIREDFLAQLDPYARMLPERLRTRYRLERLQENAALQAIKAPLSGTARSFAPDVAESLVKELLFMRTVNTVGEMTEIAGQYVEPVQLQVVCLTLWSSLPPDCTVINQEHLKGFDVSVALSDFYRDAIQITARESCVDEIALRDWFGQTLITPMQTRSTVYRGENVTGGIPNDAVDLLEGHHLIRAEYRAGVRWYELTHDRFIEAILADNADWHAKRGETLGNPIIGAARNWQRLGKDEGSLLQGAILDEANAWAQNHPNELNDLELSFLRASQERYQRDLEAKAKRARTFRVLTVALAIALVIVGVATVAAFRESERASIAAVAAQEAAIEAETARVEAEAAEAEAKAASAIAEAAKKEARAGQLALQAINNLDSDPQLSLLLAIESVNESHTFASDDALRQTLAASPTRVLSGYTGQLNALAFDSNGQLFAIVNNDETAQLWDLKSEKLVTSLKGYKGGIVAASFSPDQRLLATANTDGTAYLWDAESGVEIGSLEGHTASVNAVAFSPDGHLLATASADGTVRLWDVDNGIELASIEGHTDKVNSVIFSPDGRLLATASADGTAYLWDAVSGVELASLEGHTASVNALTFSPDGRLLATASADKTARLWDVSTGEEMSELRGHTSRVNAVAFSSNGRLLATASADYTTRLWSVFSGEVQSILRGHSASVDIVVFSPDGELLATSSSDGTTHLWNLSNLSNGESQKTLRGHDTTVWDVEFDSSGDWLISQSEDATILWDFAAIRDVNETKINNTILDGFPGYYYGLELSPDGNILALSGLDIEGGSIVSLLDVSNLPDHRSIASKTFQNQIVNNMALNDDESMLAILTTRNYQIFTEDTIQLWNLSDDLTTEINLPTSILYGIVFTSDGKRFATSGKDEVYETGVIQLWDVFAILDGNDQQDPEWQKQSQATLIYTVFGPPDDQILISGSQDGTIRFWDVSDGTERAVLRGHEGAVYGLALFESDEDESWLLASGDAFGNVRLWDVRTVLDTGGSNAEISILRGHDGPVYGVAFSPDGRWLVSAGYDKTLRIWMTDPDDLITLACQHATRNFSQDELDTYFEGNTEYYQTCINLPIHSSVIAAMINQGEEYVRQDKIDDALEIWGKVNQLDPTRELNLDMKLAQVLMDLGIKRASVDEVDQALENLRKAAELDPTLNLEPEKVVANELFNLAKESAIHGDIDKALDVLQQAVDLDPTLKGENESVEAILAGQLIDAAQDNLALVSGYKQVFDLLKERAEPHPRLKIEVAQKLVEFVNEQPEFISQVEIEAALAALSLAVELDPEIEVQQATDLVDAYTRICRLGVFVGAFYRSPELVIPACQRAVKLAEDSEYNFIGVARDSRGLARTMTGAYAGAIEDFEFFIQWAKDNNIPDAEALISQRETWIEKLEAGKNPFLEESRDQILLIMEQLIP